MGPGEMSNGIDVLGGAKFTAALAGGAGLPGSLYVEGIRPEVTNGGVSANLSNFSSVADATQDDM